MMGIMVPETCWASNKICNKNHLLHLVGILFPHINDDARSKSLQICLFRFSLKLVSETFLTFTIIKRGIIINEHRCLCKVPVIRQILMQLDFSRQIFEKYWNITFHENTSSGNRAVPYGRIDGQKNIEARRSWLSLSTVFWMRLRKHNVYFQHKVYGRTSVRFRSFRM